MYYFTPAAALPQSHVERVHPAGTLIGKRVINSDGEELGVIQEIMLDIRAGRVVYAVLSFADVLGIRDKLFAIPWQALSLDDDCECFVLDLPRRRLEQAPGFDKHNWPDMTNEVWGRRIHRFYGTDPYWEEFDPG
jgi:sporulation protein YlmC with PRC-barrel domain